MPRSNVDRSGDFLPEAGLALLRVAWERAKAANSDPWQFAVEIKALRSAGLSPNDLRWLLSQGYAEHAEELTGLEDAQRRFQPIPSLLLTARSCFILTEEGFRLTAVKTHVARRRPRKRQEAGLRPPEEKSVERQGAGGVVPRWDPVLRELWLGQTLVKRFTQPATLQEMILSAFQEEGWPASIDDPLPPEPDQDARLRLRRTVRNLNRAQLAGRIRFFINGNGQAIRWEIKAGA